MEVEIIMTGGHEYIGRRIVTRDGWVLEWDGKGRTADIWSVGMYNFRQSAIASGGTVTDAAPLDCIEVVGEDWQPLDPTDRDVDWLLGGALEQWIGGQE